MANITVTVPDDVYHAARVRAAESRTSVSALVREYLTRLAHEGDTFDRLVEKQEAVLTQIRARGAVYDAEQRISRDDVHDRDAVR